MPRHGLLHSALSQHIAQDFSAADEHARYILDLIDASPKNERPVRRVAHNSSACRILYDHRRVAQASLSVAEIPVDIAPAHDAAGRQKPQYGPLGTPILTLSSHPGGGLEVWIRRQIEVPSGPGACR